MDTSEDTDTLLALVSSLLTGPTPEPAIILDALVQCDGDVKAAAQLVKTKGARREESPAKKRKRAVDLDDWLNPSKSARGESSTRVKVQSSSKAAVPTSPTKQTSPTKPVVDLMTVLRQPPSAPHNLPRLPPLTLSTPSLVAQHTPCTHHLSVLPPELACRLFHTMLGASDSWHKNKWWLFDRVVESPHRTSFYARRRNGIDGDENWQEAAQYWYNGRKTGPPSVFPGALEEACSYVEKIVNDEMRKRERYPLEWGGTGTEGQIWRANVAASNCYEGGKESVGPHSDQLTYIGPYPTIASLSLGTSRVFRLREVVPTNDATTRRAQTFNIPLSHNTLTIMHASTQERYKHSIPPQPTIDLYRPAYPPTPGATIEPSNCRINITFRFYRPDFRPETIPRCKCGVPTILRPDMKHNHKMDKYWWTCYSGAQNDGKGCSFWQVMDMKKEGRVCIGSGTNTENKASISV